MKYIKMLLYENNELSLTRLLAVTGWIAFLIVSGVLVYKGTNWQNYETFSTMTAGGGAATQIANKFINSKYNSQSGSYKEKDGN
ncbi:MAG: hypothetical protein RLY43_7 [Bacteroidota bacterium]|jgi:hypothetical protein